MSSPGHSSIDWEASAAAVAPQLLGWELVSYAGSGRTPTVGRIVEVEAYEPDDPASHTFRGETKRNGAMFGPPGHLYCYFIYGMHVCANIVVGPVGHGAAVLIRALEPLDGVPAMQDRRGVTVDTALCSGPGKLCQAMGISLDADGTNVLDPKQSIHLRPPEAPVSDTVIVGPRIGISKAKERPWRFGLATSRHLSRPFPVPHTRRR